MPVLFLVSSAGAQANQLSITAGRALVSTQTILNSTAFDRDIHFGNEEMVEFNYGRLLTTQRIFGLFAELPVAIYPRMDVHTFQGQTPKDIGALFLTPSVRLNFFPGDSVTQWLAQAAATGASGRPRFSLTTCRTLGPPAPIPALSSSEPDWMYGCGTVGEHASKRATSTRELPP